MTNLRGKVAFITGAASGIGAETARLLAHKGARLVLVDIAADPLRALAADLGGENALAMTADVRDLDAMRNATALGISRFGRLDLVLANAGIASYGSVLAVDPDAFRRVIDVNLVGVFHTVRATLPALIENKGYVLVVSSEAAFLAGPTNAAYNASKAGAEHFATTLRFEVAHLGVGVGSAHMSWVDTPMVRDGRSDVPTGDRWIADLPRPLNKTVPVGACAAAFVRALDRRSTRVYVPRWVAALGWLKPVMNSRMVMRKTVKGVPALLAGTDAEVARLGRSMSARYAQADLVASSTRDAG